jgi:hypothetical protein
MVECEYVEAVRHAAMLPVKERSNAVGPIYRQAVQGVSNRSYVFLIAFRFAAFA